MPSQYIIGSSTLTNIADAIRLKGGTSSPMAPSEMPDLIDAIPSGGGTEIEDALIQRKLSGSYENSRVTDISLYTFYNTSLISVSFANVSVIDYSAFQYCDNLTTVYFPKATIVRSSAFAYCTNLESAVFPMVTMIGRYAFAYCDNLSMADLPLVSEIEVMAFQSCSMLSSVNIPAATRLWSQAFKSCRRLKYVSTPEVTYVDNQAFCACYNLSMISLPKVIYIGPNAFQNCYGLFSLYLMGSTIPALAFSTVFYSTPINSVYGESIGSYGSIFVPASLFESYKTASNWSYYSSRFVSI